ncbi:Protein unc-50, partial [Trichinella papuae]
LTAFGKDPRTSKVTAAECLIILARELLPFRTKIKWDELAAADDSAHSDLSRFLQFLQDCAEVMQERRPPLPASGSNPPAASGSSQVITHHAWHGEAATEVKIVLCFGWRRVVNDGRWQGKRICAFFALNQDIWQRSVINLEKKDGSGVFLPRFPAGDFLTHRKVGSELRYGRSGNSRPRFPAGGHQFIQILRQVGIEWNDPLPTEAKAQWRTWKEELSEISRIAVERALVQVPIKNITSVKLQGFADASGKAYGTVVYLRLTHGDGKVKKERRKSAALREIASRDRALLSLLQQRTATRGVTEDVAWTDAGRDRRSRGGIDPANPGRWSWNLPFRTSEDPRGHNNQVSAVFDSGGAGWIFMMDQWSIGGESVGKKKYDSLTPDHPNDVGLRDCVLFCVIVLSVRVKFDQCTSVSIDKRSLSLNKADFHCFVLLFDTFVYEHSSDCGESFKYCPSSAASARSSRSSRADGCFQHVQMTAFAKLSRYFRRLVNFKHMDFEFAIWQMLYLLVSPQKVYRNFMYRKRTKDQWARDDPAFLVMLSAALFLSSVLYAVSLWLSFTGFIKFFLWVVFVDCIGTGILFGSAIWLFCNYFLRRTSDQDVEWGYCFDVHLNAFFPVLIFLHVILPVVYPFAKSITLLGCIVGNTLWFVAIAYYIYITFLGYAALPFLKNVHFFLYPFTFFFISYVAILTLQWSISDAIIDFYRYRIGH